MGGLMSLFGGGGSTPLPEAPKIPQSEPTARRGAGDAVADAQRRRKALLSGGRRSTILGGGISGTTQSRTLLGG